MFGKKKTPTPTLYRTSVERRSLVEALVMASKHISELYGTCPFDQFNWKGCPVCATGKVDDCKNQSAKCWFSAFQDKEFKGK